MFEKDLTLSALFDLYAPLLSEKKREAFAAYFLEDLSLAEIAADTGTSRQAVRELLSRTSEELKHYEEKLNLLQKKNALSGLLEKAETGKIGQNDFSAAVRELFEL